MKNFIILSNITGLPDWLFTVFFLSAVVIVLLFYFGIKRILEILNTPTQSNSSTEIETKVEKLTLVDFCVQKLREYKFRNSEEVTTTIIKEELVMFYCEYTLKPVVVNDFLELGEQVYKKLKIN